MIIPINQYLVPLTKGKFAIVDVEGFEKIKNYKWTYNQGYAHRKERINGKSTHVSMHSFLINTPSGSDTDHINGDGLDNRLCNLRICTRTENSRNQRPRGGSSKYKGVCFDKSRGKWIAGIKINYKRKNLGRFKLEEEAAKAYNNAAKKHFGEFARLNEV